MKRSSLARVFVCWLMSVFLWGCSENAAKEKVGISFGVGEAKRWPYEMEIMKIRAKELGLEVDARLNKNENEKSQKSDCEDLINGGASVLVVVPRNADDASGILDLAHSRSVKVIMYARPVTTGGFDFFVGYDTYKIGKSLGDFAAERILRGNVAILKGDEGDINTMPLSNGVNDSIRPYVESGNINVVADEYVDGWSPVQAKNLMTEILKQSGGKIDGVLAHNDILAEAAIEAIKDYGIKNKVMVVGMDAELPALKRLVRGEQDATVYMDSKVLAASAMDVAYGMVKNKPFTVNGRFETRSGEQIDAYLINGQIVTKENLHRLIVETGVYGEEDLQ
ncbi:substrate-binding domain-containing protein [Laribacter hongkongensis]|uniref:Substrate-binding domain-containing protein n=1 Tax=Laribacter hongkongensis TaxID=168471 RepID=A0ABD4SUL8_9NEIS|nr:substrate-binding domain-containing protein [Laribacter hongkongensis]MCG9027174.1 substrate-binding domain-containing protein [Laribacter hongkongensis]MCG9100189.1 substrate-binding domain-containing protein [Laribacter hongkongensis]MCG9104905.1 substrate-binding domain-containing protein [Laribacter hongkongensis]MCG9112116.1 substrate-binding domain-containing protein [Laribacter hongkongensis]MCG9119042.1 substrate-binding domain-containing protein [Laribacter hongkongensis]